MKQEGDPVLRGWLPRWVELPLAVLGLVYLVALVGGASGAPSPLPATLEHFVHVACLFPRAATEVIDFRLEAWSCGDGAFRELDVRPYFPMHADDKENRFQRLGFFFRRDHAVLAALDAWLVERHARAGMADGVAGPIGGVRLVSLRLPIPPPGTGERFSRPPLASLPAAVKRRWYETPPAACAARCAGTR